MVEVFGHQQDRIRRVAVHLAERVGEIVGGADPEQLGGDAEFLRLGLRRCTAHRHREIVLIPQQRHRMNARDCLLEEL